MATNYMYQNGLSEYEIELVKNPTRYTHYRNTITFDDGLTFFSSSYVMSEDGIKDCYRRYEKNGVRYAVNLNNGIAYKIV